MKIDNNFINYATLHQILAGTGSYSNWQTNLKIQKIQKILNEVEEIKIPAIL